MRPFRIKPIIASSGENRVVEADRIANPRETEVNQAASGKALVKKHIAMNRGLNRREWIRARQTSTAQIDCAANFRAVKVQILIRAKAQGQIAAEHALFAIDRPGPAAAQIEFLQARKGELKPVGDRAGQNRQGKC